MTSSPEAVAAVLDALRRHRRRVMTATELSARSGEDDATTTEVVNHLQTRGLVIAHQVRIADPHFPALITVALVEDGPAGRADAERRSTRHAAVLQRQLLRSHRCQ